MKEKPMSHERQKKPGDEPDKRAGLAYEAPTVVRVSLRPDEAVLGHCKITGSAGPVSGSCRAAVACRSLGS
jgi:hypothetical protein